MLIFFFVVFVSNIGNKQNKDNQIITLLHAERLSSSEKSNVKLEYVRRLVNLPALVLETFH